MYRNPKPPEPPEEPGRETLPATFGSRLRAKAAQEAARAEAEANAGRPQTPRPSGPAPDLTRWVVLIGASVFVVLFLTAAALFVFSQFREPEALPTSLNPDMAASQAAEAALAATASAPAATATSVPVTAAPTAAPVVYIVQANDTLGTIAALYGVTVEAILQTNPEIIDPNVLVAGQQIVIPVTATQAAVITPPPTSVSPLTPAAPTASAVGDLPRSIFEGDLAGAYPRTLAGPRVTLHYQAGSFTDVTGPEIILDNAEETLADIEQRLGVTYEGPFDVYLAGSLFAAPDQALRGRAFSTQRRAFVLYDGSGTAAERRYMLAHEMTHVVAWNTYGVPSTVMLSEGLATYTGQPYLEQGGFISSTDFCRALASVNRLPSVAEIQNSTQDFLGHIRALYNYNTAACFIGYLFDEGGAEAFKELYPTSNYTVSFGEGLGQLDLDFQQSLADATRPLAFDAETLVAYYDEVQAGYDRLLSNPNPNMAAYIVLDAARVAVVTGDFATARTRLDEFKALVP